VITRGEEVKVIVSYDLFDLDIKGEKGIFLKTDEASGKHLVYFPVNGEWAELPSESIKRTRPGKVTRKNKEFINLVKEMPTTYGQE
jgi:hypothetical protein|tara:strand:+ start:1960 stop:2217 length:258 start_codon:yes stop_codon:yes gene_type:complete